MSGIMEVMSADVLPPGPTSESIVGDLRGVTKARLRRSLPAVRANNVPTRLWRFALLIVALSVAGCASTTQTTNTERTTTPTTAAGPEAAGETDPSTATSPPTSAPSAPGEAILFPDVIDASATQANDGTWTISATLSSPYDGPDRYADAWRVVGPDGTVFGERILTHDHASEQPFTRSQNGITIPSHITVVTIQGRDQQSGWGGTAFELSLGEQ